ncbi:hypothetical protein Tco_1565630 [Tanacetum coccineum]
MESPDFARYWSERPPPSYTLIIDPVLRLCHRMMAHSIAGKSQAPEKICMEVDHTWAWVAIGPERKPDAPAGTPILADDAPVVDEGDQAVLAPVQAPQQPPPPPPAAARTIPQRLRRLEEEVQGLCKDVRSLLGLYSRDAPGRGLASHHLRSTAGPTAARPIIPPILIFRLIKSGSKFRTMVHEYDTEPSRIFILNARI